MSSLSKSRIRQWLLLAAFSVVMVPTGVFLGGLLVAGPYEGNAGFFGLAGGIYTDALTGHFSALLLLFSPLLLVLIWQLAAAAHRTVQNHRALAQSDASGATD